MPKRNLRVFLLPGFFGVPGMDPPGYFDHVHPILARSLAEGGATAEIFDLPRGPTASWRERARWAAQVIEDRAPHGDLVLVGHSTGGLDARFLVSTGEDADGDERFARIARRVRAVVTVSTPHRGTPLASSFVDPSGEPLLRVMAQLASYISRGERPSDPIVTMLVEAMARLEAGEQVPRGAFEELHEELTPRAGPERRDPPGPDLEEDSGQPMSLPDLTPAAIESMIAVLRERRGVRAGSVVSRTRSSRLSNDARIGLDPYDRSLRILFRWLYRRTASMDRVPDIRLSEANRDTLEEVFTDLLTPTANDGVVPTYSQVWGEVIRAVWADHLDVLGYFHDPDATPPHVDWLSSGSPFNRADFRGLWDNVAQFICR